MINIRQVKISDLLPSSIKNDPNVAAAAGALDAELQAVTAAIDEALIFPRLDELPETVVDLLAWQWHVDFYDDSLSLETKRDLVRKSIAWHKRKGTPDIVQEMVSTVLSNGVVTEWFEYGGSPYYFKVQTDEIIDSEAVYTRLINLVNAVKNVRSWLESVSVHRTWSGMTYVGGAIYKGKTLEIGPVRFGQMSVLAGQYMGGVIHVGKTTRIGGSFDITEAMIWGLL